MEQMTPGYPQLHWHGPLPRIEPLTVEQYAARIERCYALLERGVNGEYAEQLEQDIRCYQQQIARVIALTAGVATCGHCEQAVGEGETTHAVCRATQGE